MSSSPYITRIETQRAALWEKRAPLLTALDMELTERCNLDCIHCYINRPRGDRKAAGEELSSRRIKTYLKEAADLGCMTVRFTGGEPLLRSDFEDIYLTARKLGLKVLLFTNATLITPRLAELFARIPPLEPIEITLYGMKQTSYEAVTRTPGSFDACRRGVQRLIKKNIPLFLKFTILPQTINELGLVDAYAASIPSLEGPPAFIMLYNLRGRRDSELKNDAIRNLRLSPAHVVAALSRNRNRYLDEMQSFCSRFIGPPAEALFSCGAGKGSGCISAGGRFQPCLLLKTPETSVDLAHEPLREALTRVFPKVRKIKATNPAYLDRCARCFLKGLCEQCPARSWMEHGTLDTPVKYLCRVAHAQAVDLGLLDENEKGWAVRDWQTRLNKFSKKVKII